MTTIPLSPAQVSADWLAQVIAGPDSDAKLRSVVVEDANAGTTGRLLLSLEWSADSDLPHRVFIKLPPDDETQRAFVAAVGMGRAESRFYRDLSAELPIPIPRCYYADFNDAGDRYIMVLENLEARGCQFRNASSRYSIDYLREVLSAFARLHAAFWASPRFADDLAWIKPPAFHDMGPRLVQRAMERHASEMPPVFSEMGSLYLENTAAIHSIWNQGVPTLVHGDCHDGNLYYDPDAGPGFLDWGVLGRTSCMRDVAYFLAGTPAPEDRVEHLPDLLQFYLNALRELGVAQVDEAALQREFRWHTAYVWVGAATTLAMGDEWQPSNYVRRTMERLNLALESSQSVEALRESIA